MATANSVTFTETKQQPIVQEGWGVVVLDLHKIFPLTDIDNPNCPYQKLVNQAYSLKMQVEKVVAEIDASTIEGLEAQHEAARIAARDAKEAFETAKQQEIRYKNLVLQAQSQYDNAYRLLANLKNNPPHPNTYPSKEELAVWEQAVANATENADKSQQNIMEANRDSQMYYSGLNTLASEYTNAASKEREVRSKLSSLKGVSQPSNDNLGFAN
jgi:hemerythrin-like domain-containing protein